MSHGRGSSAAAVAAARAYENGRCDALFVDALSSKLAGAEGVLALSRLGGEALASAVAVRTRWFDDAIQRAARAGVRTFVALGAGLDTRPWRLPLRRGSRWIDVDREHVLHRKRSVLEGVPLQPGVDRRSIAADVRGAGVLDLVERHLGRRGSRPTLFVIEGLLGYLEPSEAEDLMRGIAKRGDGALVDIVEPDVERRPGPHADVMARLSELGEPWKFAANDPTTFFRACGLDAEVTPLDEVAERLGRPMPSATSIPGRPRAWVVACGRVPSAREPSEDLAALFVEADHPSSELDVARYLSVLPRPNETVLEIGAGAGRLALPLAHAGHGVVAVDRDASRLSSLRRRLREIPRAVARRVRVLEHDFGSACAPELPTRPTVALFAYNTLLEIGDAQAQLSALRAAARVLAPGGRIALDVVNPDRLPADGDPAERRSARRVTELGSYVRSARAGPISGDGSQLVEGWYEHGDPPQRLPFAVRHHHLPLERLRALVVEAGFAVESVEGDRAGCRWTPESETTFLVARRIDPR